MAATHISIRVELVSGRGETFWPRPGRLFLASRTHTFAKLAEAIETAFARWDRSHLWQFDLADGTCPTLIDPDDDWDLPGAVDGSRTKLARLVPGQRFMYTYDFGDDWTHLCTVGDELIDPDEMWGKPVGGPLPYFGWGTIPDQYGRGWEEDDGSSLAPPAPDPMGSDLPDLPGWGH